MKPEDRRQKTEDSSLPSSVLCHLIPDWRDAWRFFSVWVAGAMAVLSSAWDYLPEIREYIPDGWVKWAALAVILARILRQKERVQ
jgi:hypothetical protein